MLRRECRQEDVNRGRKGGEVLRCRQRRGAFELEVGHPAFDDVGIGTRDAQGQAAGGKIA